MSADPRRVEEMRRLYESGMTMREVGEKFGITHQRVFQLFKAHGIKRRPRGARPVAQPSEAEKREIVREYLAGVSRKQLALSHGLTAPRLDSLLSKELSPGDITDRNRRRAMGLSLRDWTDADLIAALLDCAADLGPKFGMTAYSQWRNEQVTEYPSVGLFSQRRPQYATDATEASWNEWRRRADLPLVETHGALGVARFDDDAMYRALGRVEDLVGKFPSIGEYDALRDPESEPTAGTIRRRHQGRWSVVRDSFETWKGSSYEASGVGSAGPSDIGR